MDEYALLIIGEDLWQICLAQDDGDFEFIVDTILGEYLLEE